MMNQPGFVDARLQLQREDIDDLVGDLRRNDAPAALATLQRIADQSGSTPLQELFERAKFSPVLAGGRAE